jgi:chromosomal replication initiation ATPase DnaA
MSAASGLTPVQLLIFLAKEMLVSTEDLRGWDRRKRISAMRAIAMATIREHCGMSYPELALLFGARHHTTAMAYVQRAARARVEYPLIAAAASRALGQQQWSAECAVEALELCA